MKFSRNRKILLMLLLIGLNFIMRIPIMPHQLGLDTFYIQHISDTITTYGLIQSSHPLQFLGFSSQPLSVPVLISGMSQNSALDSELIILYLSLITGILGIFTYYIFMSYITHDDLLSYLAALIFSLSPEFLRMTIWTATTRALFIAIVPLFLYFLFKSIDKERRITYFLLFITIFCLLMATHHLGTFLFICTIAFLVTLILNKLQISIFVSNKRLNDLIPWIIIVTIFFSMSIFRIGYYKEHTNLWSIYKYGFFLEGDSPAIILINLIVDYSSKIGILLPLALIGIIALFLFKKQRNFYDNYILILLITFTPILTVGVYTPMFLLAILPFLISFGIITLLNNNIMHRHLNIMFSLILISLVCFSMFMMFHWGYKMIQSDADKYMAETKNTGMFLKGYGGDGSFTSNERGGTILKYSVYSGMPSAPGGIYSNRTNGKKPEVKAKLNLDFKEIFSGGVENIITFENVKIENDNQNSTNQKIITTSTWYMFPKLWSGDLEAGKDIINTYNILYSVETNFGGYSVYYVKNMRLFNDIHASKPKIYDNTMEEIYYIK